MRSLSSLGACAAKSVAAAAFVPALALLTACATQTTATLTPSPQAPLCDPAASALVLWAPHWRADQKDVAAREDAAAAGLRAFFDRGDCFARTELRRVAQLPPALLPGAGPGAHERVIGVEVRELGPVVRLLASAALVEGGTEVVLRLARYAPATLQEQRGYAVHWRSGGPGTVRGVATLPQDMQAALQAGFWGSGAPRP
ncbi:MAG TPA: hypothetical protein PKD73_17110 [Burkholderiaceae bacterium]|nr:hypothetical protein [Burkholderiaceae bacterium]